MSVYNDSRDWNSTMQLMKLNDTELWNNTANPWTTLAFVTGYRYIGVPSSMYFSICAKLGATNPDSIISCSASSSRISATGSCSNYAPFNVSMQFNTTATYVIPSTGMTYYSPTSNVCYWNFQKVGNGTEFIIGEQFY